MKDISWLHWFSFYSSWYGLFCYWMTPEQAQIFKKFSISSFRYITNISLLVNMLSILYLVFGSSDRLKERVSSFNNNITFCVFIFYWPLYLFVDNSLNVQKLNPKIGFWDDMTMHGFPYLISMVDFVMRRPALYLEVVISVVVALTCYATYLAIEGVYFNGNWVYPILRNRSWLFRFIFFGCWVSITVFHYIVATWIINRRNYRINKIYD